MHQRLLGLPAFECRFQGLADLLCAQTVVHVMADDLSRPCSHYQAEVDETPVGRQVRDTGHPDLLAPAGAHLPGASLQQVRMSAKPVVAVGGLVTGPPGRYQQAGLTQNVKQCILPEPGLRLLQRVPAQVVQLARADPRLTQPPHCTNSTTVSARALKRLCCCNCW